MEDIANPKPATSAACLPREAERESQSEEGRTGRKHLRAPEAEHGTAQYPQAARLQLEAHQEKQEHHAELGELQRGFDLPDHAQAPGADQHPGAQIAEHCAELQALEERYEQHRGDEEDGSLFEEMHGTIRRTGCAALCASGAARGTGCREAVYCYVAGIPATAVSMLIEPKS